MRHEALVRAWAFILKQAGFHVLIGGSVPTYAAIFGDTNDISHGRQGKPDIFVPDWTTGHALFDVGITHHIRQGSVVVTENAAAQANRMAYQKREVSRQGSLRSEVELALS